MSPLGDRIQLRFKFQGKEIRPTLGLRPTTANLQHAIRLRARIVEEIRFGTFSLSEHFPEYKNKLLYRNSADSDSASLRSFGDWCEVWCRLKARELEHSTLKIYSTHLAHYWTSVWSTSSPRKISHEMVLERLSYLATDELDKCTGKLVRKGIGRKTQNNILITLRSVFEMIGKALKIPSPVAGIKCLEVQEPPPDPFTREEIEVILSDLQRPRPNIDASIAMALADYFEFAAFAGPRPSEQIELRWSDVDMRNRTVRISRANVLNEIKDRTKTNKPRIVELNDRAWSVIERQRERTQCLGDPACLIFLNPFTGKAWVSGEEQRREWVESLRRVGVRYRPPKELRDTSVTLALSAGADPYYVANQHGHSLQTMLKNYAGYIPNADRGRNRLTINAAIAVADSAVDTHKATTVVRKDTANQQVEWSGRRESNPRLKLGKLQLCH